MKPRTPASPRRDLTVFEQNIRNYIDGHPGRTQEDVIKHFSNYDPSLVTYAVRHLISDGWLDEDQKNYALYIRNEPPSSEELEKS